MRKEGVLNFFSRTSRGLYFRGANVRVGVLVLLVAVVQFSKFRAFLTIRSRGVANGVDLFYVVGDIVGRDGVYAKLGIYVWGLIGVG